MAIDDIIYVIFVRPWGPDLKVPARIIHIDGDKISVKAIKKFPDGYEYMALERRAKGYTWCEQ